MERGFILSSQRSRRHPTPGPFLKWVGGKRQILPALLAHRPTEFKAYHEPFAGGGALFFALQRAGLLSTRRNSLTDVNAELVGTYRAIQDDVEIVIKALEQHRYDKKYFYKVRDWEPNDLDPAEQAARMIFLNRAGFNGLYRVNSKGKFNVPFGSYKNPRICDHENLRAVHHALDGIKIPCESFKRITARAKAGDFVYFDPPYVPVSDTANFVSYAKNGFSMADQEELAETFAKLVNKGVFVLLSNSDTQPVRRMYADFRIETVQASRMVNARSDRRGPVTEVMVIGGYEPTPSS
ncbi:MAG: DNA adenine methylase [Deltaproteobacteria bacterium]|nr:DNA adenine methylase [Deltaproteobacteria bacterium]